MKAMRKIMTLLLVLMTGIAQGEASALDGCLETAYMDYLTLQERYYMLILGLLKNKDQDYLDALNPLFNYQRLTNASHRMTFEFYLTHDISHIRFNKLMYAWSPILSSQQQPEYQVLSKDKKILENFNQVQKAKLALKKKHPRYREAKDYLKNTIRKIPEMKEMEKDIYNKGHQKADDLHCQ